MFYSTEKIEFNLLYDKHFSHSPLSVKYVITMKRPFYIVLDKFSTHEKLNRERKDP